MVSCRQLTILMRYHVRESSLGLRPFDSAHLRGHLWWRSYARADIPLSCLSKPLILGGAGAGAGAGADVDGERCLEQLVGPRIGGSKGQRGSEVGLRLGGEILLCAQDIMDFTQLVLQP